MSTYASTPARTLRARNGIDYGYRPQGAPAARPLVMLQHFRGNLDNWDPQLIDALSASREVVVFDNVGVGATSGITPASVTEMAHGALAFIDALELDDIDLLGFSLGGFIAQEIALIRPDLLHRLVLAATAPQGAPGMHGWARDIIDAVGSPKTTGADLLHAFSRAPRPASRQERSFLDASPSEQWTATCTNWQTRNAHYDAVVQWGIPNISMLERLQAIATPVFVANGDDDRMILPRYSHLLAGLIDGAIVKIYPDSAHGFLFQHRAEFAADVHTFLDTPRSGSTSD